MPQTSLMKSPFVKIGVLLTGGILYLYIVSFGMRQSSDSIAYLHNGMVDPYATYPCGKNKRMRTIPRCAKMLAECMKKNCNEDMTKGQNYLHTVKINDETVRPLPISNQTDLGNNTFSTDGYTYNALRLTICRDANIGYVHIYKAAGTYSIMIFKKFCEHITGKEPETSVDRIDPNLKLWTTLRKPGDRFVSAMFELSYRKGQKTEGGIESIITSLKDEKSSNETIVAQFMERYMNNYSYYDMHLHPQLDFLFGVDKMIYPHLDYAIHLDDGFLDFRIVALLHHMFKESYASYGNELDLYEYGITSNFRNHNSDSYGTEESNKGKHFFQNLKFGHLNEAFQDKVNTLYEMDNQCFSTCGY